MPELNHHFSRRASFVVTAVALIAATTAEGADLWCSDGMLRARVQYSDLNLSTPGGARTLLHRLKRAAKQVCNPLLGPGLQHAHDWQVCYERALGNGVEAAHRSNVTALYERARHTGRGS